MRRAILAVLMLAMAFGPARSAELSLVRGIVADAGEDGGRIWFGLDHVEQRFMLPKGAAGAAAWPLLVRSNSSRHTLAVRYDIDAGRVDRESRVIFEARELIFDGVSHVLPASGKAPAARTEGETHLARGVALYSGEAYADTRSAIDKALADRRLTRAQKTLAHKIRGNAADDLAFETAAGSEFDQLIMAAKSDFEQWRAHSPDSVSAALAVAGAMEALGAYDEAMAIYLEVQRKWPQASFWAMIRTASLQRKLGRHDQALGTMDTYAASHGGDVDGMPFHYHRAWILTALNRHAEAVTEITEGLKSQPEYPWALARRACAYAGLGRIGEALADQEVVVALMDRIMVENPATPSKRHDFDRARAIIGELRAARDKSIPSDVPCVGYWKMDEPARQPSKLLTSAAG